MLEESAAEEWRKHWPVVLASTLGVGLMSLPVYASGVFIGPLEKEFGWSRAAISSGLMFNAVTALCLGPFIGHAIDRHGPRRFALTGAVLICCAFALLATVNGTLWSWWLVWVLIALAGVCIHPMVWTSAVSSLFTASRGLALAVTLCGTALASSLTPVIGSYLIDRHGWRLAYLGLAGFFAVLVLPALFFLFTSAADRHRAELRSGRASRAPILTGVGPREGLISFRFLRLVLAATTMVLAAVTCVMNLVPILMWSGHPRATAAGIASAVGLSTVAGRATAGWLLDRISGNLVAAVSVGLPVTAYLLLIFEPRSTPAAVAAASIVGLALGAELDTVAYLTSRHFGLRSFGFLFGVVGGVLNVATAAGPLLASFVYDVTRSYEPVLWAFVPISLLGSVLFATLGRYPDFDRETVSAPVLEPVG
jgi:MFS family permease